MASASSLPHASVYAAVLDVPLVKSSSPSLVRSGVVQSLSWSGTDQSSLQPPASATLALTPVTASATRLHNYPFTAERAVIERSLKYTDEQKAIAAEAEARKQRIAEKRKTQSAKLEDEALKQAKANASQPSHKEQTESSDNTSAQSDQSSAQYSTQELNYLEFEQGLPPLNPWDAPNTLNDDLAQLGDVMGASLHRPGDSLDQTRISQQQQQQQQQQRPLVPPLLPKPQQSTPPSYYNRTQSASPSSTFSHHPTMAMPVPMVVNSPNTITPSPTNYMVRPTKLYVQPPRITSPSPAMLYKRHSTTTPQLSTQFPLSPPPAILPIYHVHINLFFFIVKFIDHSIKLTGLNIKKVFHDIAAMGFSPAVIEVAIVLFRDDHKKITDFCLITSPLHPNLNANELIQSFQPFTNDKDLDRFSRYITSYAKLREMGYYADRVQQALFGCNFDEMEALDGLMCNRW